MTKRGSQELFIFGAGAVLVVATVPPVLALLPDLALSRDAIAKLLSSPRAGVLLLASIRLASAVTLVSLLIGVPLGLIVGRCNVMAPRATWAVHTFPMF